MPIRLSLFALALLLAAGCGGGGSSSPTPVAPTSAPTAGATATPSATPTVAPTASPVPLSLKVIGGAPLTATASELSSARVHAQAHTQSQGVTNGLPILVESSGMVALVAATQAVWVTNAQTSQDIPETGGTVTATNNLPINNPGFSQACIGSLAPVCIVHPTGWQYGTSSANGKPVGKQTVTLSYADGTTSQTNDYIYDGWTMPCNGGWVYQGNIPVATTTRAGSDVYADCVNSNVVFPQGAIVLANPSPDQYGRTETIMPTLTTQPVFISAIVNVSFSSIAAGTVIGIQTADGGFAKIYFTSQPGQGTLASANGMALHSQTNGAFAF